MAKKAKQLRFAALIRVSTERQEKRGESLKTQTKQINDDVPKLGGTIIGWYGGQEHATPGHVTAEVDRLVSDATKGKFDAVIVAHQDRWSRDNVKSKAGLAVFQKHGIRFFVRGTEYDLDNPTARLFLGISAEIGEFQAANQSQKSIQNRIERAKRGLPTVGKLPFGRTFDKETGKWGIDKAKQKMIQDIAKRYLAKEPEQIMNLAAEYGVNGSNLHHNLMHRCGSEWTQEFDSESLNIHEIVTIQIPALLPAKTIAALRKQAAANGTYKHGQTKNKYLLGRMVFCSHCGYALSGTPNRSGLLYYKHRRVGKDIQKKVTPCPHGNLSVRADALEENVICRLFECFGNPKAMERAIAAAIPNPKKVLELQETAERLAESQIKIKEGREKILRLVVKGSIKEEAAQAQLEDLNRDEESNATKLNAIAEQLKFIPSAQSAKVIADAVTKQFKFQSAAKRWAISNQPFAKMSWDDKRELAQTVFGGLLPDGRRMGVYISWDAAYNGAPAKRVASDPNRPWRFSLLGQVINQEGLLPETSEALHHNEFGPGTKRTTKSALC